MTPELITKFSNLSNEQQLEVIKLIEKMYLENEQSVFTLANNIMNENIELFRQLSDQ